MAGCDRGKGGYLKFKCDGSIDVVVVAEHELKSTSWWRRRRCATIGNRIDNGSSRNV